MMPESHGDGNQEVFLQPRLRGKRFDSGSVPLDVLKDLSVIEEMMEEIARQLYLREHPNRIRSPRSFLEGISLHLTSIESGSAIPNIAILRDSDFLPEVGTLGESYLIRARNEFLALIRRASENILELGSFPDPCLRYFDRLGRSLRDDESMELIAPDFPDRPVLSKRIRRRLTLLSANAKIVTDEVMIRGVVSEMDQGKSTFQLTLVNGSRIVGPVPPQHFEKILKAFDEYKDRRPVHIYGVGQFDRYSRLITLESIEQFELLEFLDVQTRLEELALLKNGWLEGGGLAPSQEGLEWFGVEFRRHFPDDLPLPHIYPTPEGGLQAEWSTEGAELSLEVNLQSRMADWCMIAKDADGYEERSIDLSNDSGWKVLEQEVRAYQEVVA
jgi:hypothetical protein